MVMAMRISILIGARTSARPSRTGNGRSAQYHVDGRRRRASLETLP
jgi:hypothetical protein